MAFTWTKPISVGNLGAAAALQEIRSNLDYIDNNLACITHNSAYYSSADSTVNDGYYSAQDSNANSTIYSYNDTSIYNGADAGVACLTYWA
ncbi:MAG: hypothetical protein AB1563_07530 [Bacillota bacterium]